MSFVILVAGLPGTGKTSFAVYLGQKLNIPVVSKDTLKELLFDTVGFKSREEKVTLGTAAMEIMYHIAETHIKTGNPIILENNFENISKPGLLKLVSQYGCRTITVRFTTEMNTLAERFRERDKSPNRHRGHVVNTQYPEPKNAPPPIPAFDPLQYYSSMKHRGMDTFSIGGAEITVDTTDFSAVSYDDIISKIERFLNPD